MEQSLLLLQHEIDWAEFRRALAWSSTTNALARNNVTERFSELRKYEKIPIEVTHLSRQGKFSSIWQDYQRHKDAGAGSLCSYLRTRWDAGSNTELPALALKMFAQFWATRRDV